MEPEVEHRNFCADLVSVSAQCYVLRMLNERTGNADIAALRERARRARETAAIITDKESAGSLVRSAKELEAEATALEAAALKSPPTSRRQ